MSNIHVPEHISKKYPNMEFRGKRKIILDREVIEAYNPTTNQRFWYSFEEDFFWFTDQIPTWKLK